ncbi:MAG: hypothetical protein MHPSP_003820, partial [Paramarteilia canceri]
MAVYSTGQDGCQDSDCTSSQIDYELPDRPQGIQNPLNDKDDEFDVLVCGTGLT